MNTKQRDNVEMFISNVRIWLDDCEDNELTREQIMSKLSDLVQSNNTDSLTVIN